MRLNATIRNTQSLYEELAPKGFEVLTFPANNFGAQEPGSNDEILKFCTTNFSVTFPVAKKIDVVGESTHPLFQQLAQTGGEPDWNFTKYLIDTNGQPVTRFSPRTAPDSDEIRSAIQQLLDG